MWPYVEGSVSRDDFEAMVTAAYATFDHPEVCPVVEVDDLHLLELFWGPTLAFKDVAPSSSAACSTTSCPPGASAPPSSWRHRGTRARRPSRRASAATPSTSSCSTLGSGERRAARQMTTVDAPNVHNVAVEGTFDDCQDLVKRASADMEFRPPCGCRR